LITMNETGELNKIQINGKEVRKIITDLNKDQEEGGSILIRAISNTYSKLRDPPDEQTTKLPLWRVVLWHWGVMMAAAYVTKATDANRATFAEHARLYVMEKANVRAGITTWYDWQLYSIMPKIFFAFGSLSQCNSSRARCSSRIHAEAQGEPH